MARRNWRSWNSLRLLYASSAGVHTHASRDLFLWRLTRRKLPRDSGLSFRSGGVYSDLNWRPQAKDSAAESKIPTDRVSTIQNNPAGSVAHVRDEGAAANKFVPVSGWKRSSR